MNTLKTLREPRPSENPTPEEHTDIYFLCLVAAASIVLSSTAGAAEQAGSHLGEFVEAGEYGGQPYYRQRDTDGRSENFLFSEGGEWLVGGILGKPNGWLLNRQDSPRPPTDDRWTYWDGEKWNADDTSLTLKFTTLSPCQLVRVAGEGDVVEQQGSSLGNYRSVFISVTLPNIIQPYNM